MMKKVFIVMLVILVSCQNQDKKAIAIKKRIIQNGFGDGDMGYKPILTEKTADVSYQELLDIYLKEVDTKLQPIDTLIYYTAKAKETQRRENNVVSFHFFNHSLKRLKNYKNIADKNTIAYSVYKHNYSIINSLLNNIKVDITNYYFFTSKDSLIGFVNDSDFKSFKNDYIQHDKQYLEALYRKITID